MNACLLLIETFSHFSKSKQNKIPLYLTSANFIVFLCNIGFLDQEQLFSPIPENKIIYHSQDQLLIYRASVIHNEMGLNWNKLKIDVFINTY